MHIFEKNNFNHEYETELRTRIFEYFIKPFSKKNNEYVGMELEFPIINLKQPLPDPQISQKILFMFMDKMGFIVDQSDFNNQPVRIINKIGDAISFEGTLNTLEFSMAAAVNLQEIRARFNVLFNFAQQFLLSHNHILSGLGLHPYYDVIDIKPLESGRQYVLSMLLSKDSDGFGVWTTSSVQTHLNVTQHDLVDILNLLTLLSFISAKLFSNSAYLSGKNANKYKVLCCRDYCYRHFGSLGKTTNTGGYSKRFNNLEDLVLDLETRSMCRVFRENTGHIFFEPTILKDFFCTPKISGCTTNKNGTTKECCFTPTFADLNSFRSYNIVEPRPYGTIEVRGDCIQPLSTTFAPTAFYIGILQNWHEIAALLAPFKGFNPMELRKQVINRQLPGNITKKQFSHLITQTLSIAEAGLIMRGFREEEFIQPLYKRAETLKSPAEENLDMLQKGMTITDVIKFNATAEFLK